MTITQKMADAEILPGVRTPIFGYNGIAPGPTILARRGTPLSVVMRNELPAKHPNWGYESWTSCHLHGSASKPQYDGYASDITRSARARPTSSRTTRSRARSGTTTTACTTRPRTPTWASPRCTS